MTDCSEVIETQQAVLQQTGEVPHAVRLVRQVSVQRFLSKSSIKKNKTKGCKNEVYVLTPFVSFQVDVQRQPGGAGQRIAVLAALQAGEQQDLHGRPDQACVRVQEVKTCQVNRDANVASSS